MDARKKLLLQRLNSFTSQASDNNLSQVGSRKSRNKKRRPLNPKLRKLDKKQSEMTILIDDEEGEKVVTFNKDRERRSSIFDISPEIDTNSKLNKKGRNLYKVPIGPSKALQKIVEEGGELTATQRKILSLENRALNNFQMKTLKLKKKTLNSRASKKISKISKQSSMQTQLQKTDEQKEFLMKLLVKVHFLADIAEKTINVLIDKMYLETVEEGERVIREGQKTSRFYIIYKGAFVQEDDSWDNTEETLYQEGDAFGHLGLIHDAPSEHTVTAKEPSQVFILERNVYSSIIAKTEEKARRMLVSRLAQVPVLHGLEEETLEELVDFITEKKYHKGDQIIKKGETGNELYILKSGSVKCTNIGETDGVMNDIILYENDYFGEIALVKKQPRAADIYCESDVAILYEVSREVFEKVFGPLKELLEENWKLRILQSIPIFSEIDDGNVLKGLLKVSEEEECTQEGTLLIEKDKKLRHFYIILEGKVCIYAHKRMMPKRNQTDADNNKVDDIEDKDSVYGFEYEDSSEKQTSMGSPKEKDSKASRLARRKVEQIGDLVGKINDQTKSQTQEAAKEITDENGIQKELVEVVESGRYIGESCLVNEVPFADAITLTSVVKLLKFDVAKVNKVLSTPIPTGASGAVEIVDSDSEPDRRRRRRKKKKSSNSKKYSNIVKAKVEKSFEEKRRNTMLKEKADIRFHDLKQYRTLGTGTFGRVRLSKDKVTNNYYALKIISKKKVVEYGQKINVYNEKQAMLESDHPFILKLFATFKDEKNIYMLLELVQGGELFSLMRKLKRKTDGRFYAACVLLGIEYLHNKRIIYRDIKPENILLDKTGYVKIVDFGFAKRVKSRTYTMCGTPEYMAPEIFLRKGYNRAVDFWALGICFFEMCYGFTPFGDGGKNDHVRVCKNIVNKRLKYPPMNEKALNRLKTENRAKREKKYRARKRLVKALLRKDPRTRAGMKRNGVEQIKNEEVFQSINWEKLARKEVKAPWTPRIKDEKDCTHFMKYPEDDEEEEYVDDGSGWDKEF